MAVVNLFIHRHDMTVHYIKREREDILNYTALHCTKYNTIQYINKLVRNPSATAISVCN